jgi:hypothetical protein
MRRCVLPCLTVVAFVAVGAIDRAVADFSPIVTIGNTTGDQHTEGQFTIGWSFHTNAQLVVRQLGIFDDRQDGLKHSHEVGIFDGGTELAKVTVASGTTDPLINQFRYHSLSTPLTLAADKDYTIGALYSTEKGEDDDFLVFPDATRFGIDGRIRFIHSLYTPGGTLMAPATDGPEGHGYFGPNFTVAPEPSSFTLFALATFGFSGGVLRRRKRSAHAGS